MYLHAENKYTGLLLMQFSSLGALEFTIPSMEVLFTDMIPIISTTGAIPALPTRVSLPEVPRLTALPAWAAYPFPSP